MAVGQTLAEMFFPSNFSTAAHHYLLEVFQRKHGRVDRFGTTIHYHMPPLERVNRLLRLLMKAHKNLPKHLLLSYVRMIMVEVQRATQPADFFPTAPRHQHHMQWLLPAYLTPDGEMSLSFDGREKLSDLSARDLDMLHSFFLNECPIYRSAHLKFAQVRCTLPSFMQ